MCDTTSNACVGCLSSTNCTDTAKPQCNTATKTCVACLSNSDCKTPAASKCDLTTGSSTINTCGPCSVDGDCSLITGKNACLTGVTGQANQCVVCTTANETACVTGGNAYSCNPKTNVCTTTVKGSRKTCQSCLADSECGTNAGVVDPNSRCAPMTFNGSAHGTGGYCLQVATLVNCVQPYKVTFTAKSLSGLDGTYCGINQTATTCEAVLDLFNSKTCISSSNCGGGDGGLCEDFSLTSTPDLRCTIPCTLATDCFGSNTCSGSTNGYCK